jgi:SAM-dependent methyltransferase
MVNSATKNKEREAPKYKNVSFFEGDILKLDGNQNLRGEYDIVFTDRCIINLNSPALQFTALDNLIRKVRKGGYLVILENIRENHSRQNDCREAVGLPRREVPPYNLFINEADMLSFVSKSMKLKETIDFASLHDLILYVLVPMTNGGVIDYNHPVVHAATDFLMKSSEVLNNSFGSFGQNRLYLFHKE